MFSLSEDILCSFLGPWLLFQDLSHQLWVVPGLFPFPAKSLLGNIIAFQYSVIAYTKQSDKNKFA